MQRCTGLLALVQERTPRAVGKHGLSYRGADSMVNDNKPYPTPEERAEAEQSTQELIAAQGQVPGTGRADWLRP